MRIRIKQILARGIVLVMLVSGLDTQASPCKQVASRCVEGRATRIVEGFSVTRDCWKYNNQYECLYTSKNDCDPLIKQDCIQIGSDTCIKTVRDKCVVHQNKYSCFEEVQSTNQETRIKQENAAQNLSDTSCSKGIPCLDGSCKDTSYAANDELLESAAQISTLVALKDQLKSNVDPKDLRVFKGDVEMCRVDIVGFRNCCGASTRGWGTGLGIVNCTPEQKALMQKRTAGLCHDLGPSFCTQRFLGKCITRKKSYCCFKSKAAKIINEAGRAQLGKNFGAPQNPDCSGFTVDELLKVDFSKLNLAGLYGDVKKQYEKSLNSAKARIAVVESMKDSFSKLQEDFKNPPDNQLPGKKNSLTAKDETTHEKVPYKHL